MAKEYIERKAVYQYLDNEVEWRTNQDRLFALEAVSDFPTADVAQVRHGRWEKAVESQLDTHTGEYWEEYYYNCLECDYASEWKSPYCPNCGAKMDLEG